MGRCNVIAFSSPRSRPGHSTLPVSTQGYLVEGSSGHFSASAVVNSVSGHAGHLSAEPLSLSPGMGNFTLGLNSTQAVQVVRRHNRDERRSGTGRKRDSASRLTSGSRVSTQSRVVRILRSNPSIARPRMDSSGSSG